MHIRHIPLYALGAGALVVSVMLFGDGDGADAATGAVTDAVNDAVNTAAPASDSAHPVVVQPDTVAPGAAFSVYDGGNCPGGVARATFGSADIPTMQLSALSNQVGGTAIMPQGIAPGTYTVTVTCDSGGGSGSGGAGGKQSHAAYGGSGGQRSALDRARTGAAAPDRRQGDDEWEGPGAAPGDGSGDGSSDEGGSRPGEDATAYTGTVSVSDGADEEVLPQGGSQTGLGGAAGTSPATTALGGLLFLGAAGWGALAHRRRARGTQG